MLIPGFEGRKFSGEYRVMDFHLISPPRLSANQLSCAVTGHANLTNFESDETKLFSVVRKEQIMLLPHWSEFFFLHRPSSNLLPYLPPSIFLKQPQNEKKKFCKASRIDFRFPVWLALPGSSAAKARAAPLRPPLPVADASSELGTK